VNFFAIVTIIAQFTSVHEVEYNQYANEAHWTPVLTTPVNLSQTNPRTVGMLKNYYGYLPYWIDTIYYQYFQMDLVSHISYFSVEIDPATGSLGLVPNQDRFLKIISDAHAAGVIVHMTFIIFGSSSVSNFLNNKTARDSAIYAMSNFISNYGIDGVNIDFEFVTGSVRDSFNLFVNGLCTTLWNHPEGRKELYLATIAVPSWYPGYDLVYLSNHSDGLFIMGYDFHWSGSSTAGPVSPCVPSVFWGEYCVAKSIGSYRALGVDGSKIILGLPYYGYDWPTLSGDSGSAATGTGTGVIYYYAFQNANTHGMLWDEYSLTPWYKYYTTEWHQCWFDDSVSLDIKFGMVNDSLLQGAGCWALGYDRTYDHLWNTVRRNFWDSTGVGEYNNTIVRNSVLLPTISRENFVLSLPNTASSYEISLYDVTGRKLTQLQSSGNKTVNFGNHLRAGVYYVEVKSNRELFRHKIIKIH
jgi:spore germination protein YaaH